MHGETVKITEVILTMYLKPCIVFTIQYFTSAHLSFVMHLPEDVPYEWPKHAGDIQCAYVGFDIIPNEILFRSYGSILCSSAYVHKIECWSSQNSAAGCSMYIRIFVNCNWVDTRWQ